MKSVYIASPYSKGNQAEHVRLQIDMAEKLFEAGYAPFTPLLSHFQHMVYPRPYEHWITQCLFWVVKCDIVLRVGGESIGADLEADLAKSKDIPVYYSIEELIKNS